MNPKAKTIVLYTTLLIVGLFFFFWGLAKAKAFLAPLAVAILLAMVILPLCRWFERKGMSRGWASLFSDLVILLFFVMLAGVVAAQIKNLTQDWPQIQKRMQPKIEQLQEFIADKTGLSIQEQDQRILQYFPFGSVEDESKAGGKSAGLQRRQQQADASSESRQRAPDRGQPAQGQEQTQAVQEQQPTTGASSAQSQQSGNVGSMLSTAGNFIGGFLAFLGTFLLIFVYIFFFLLYRDKFHKSMLKIAPGGNEERTGKVISESASLAQSYLFGRLLLILILAILYSIGLSVSGVKQAILISIIAALLSLIPYIGNILGFFLALAMALLSGSGLTGAIGVAITFAIAQFVESYILEPYIVGDKVNLNPVVVIVVVVLGNAVWGVIGMLIAIPALGVAKVVFDQVPVLNPLGYLFGEEDIGDEDSDEPNIFQKTKRWALRKFNKD